MANRGARVLAALLIVAGGACVWSEPADRPDCNFLPPGVFEPPAGTRRGEPYRWLGRSWRSPLGLTIRTYGLAVEGVPVTGIHQVEIDDARGQLVHSAGSVDALLAELRARGAAWPDRHPLASLSGARDARAHPAAHTTQRAVWYRAHGTLVAAVATERVNLLDDPPVGEIVVRDAATGAELTRYPILHELNDPDYLVYAGDDGRPLPSPLGNTLPHPTGVPDKRVPAPVKQRLRRQSTAVAALADPWLPGWSRQTAGNNVTAFFNSLLDAHGQIASITDEFSQYTPEYGPDPEPDNDFFAFAGPNGFVFSYDPTKTASEYFQDGMPGTPAPPPDPRDVALNAKIVAGFYATNWLHDYFYRAGFDESAGNAQLSNHGRGGYECDALIVHS